MRFYGAIGSTRIQATHRFLQCMCMRKLRPLLKWLYRRTDTPSSSTNASICFLSFALITNVYDWKIWVRVKRVWSQYIHTLIIRYYRYVCDIAIFQVNSANPIRSTYLEGHFNYLLHYIGAHWTNRCCWERFKMALDLFSDQLQITEGAKNFINEFAGNLLA